MSGKKCVINTASCRAIFEEIIFELSSNASQVRLKKTINKYYWVKINGMMYGTLDKERISQLI